MPVKYEEDIVIWAQQQADLIRRRQFDQLDIEHVVEEIEEVSRSDKRELMSRLTLLLQHLLKWQFQPERQSGSWRATIVTQRDDLADLLEQSPSLRNDLSSGLDKAYARAVKRARIETRVERFPDACPFSVEQILRESFWPE